MATSMAIKKFNNIGNLWAWWFTSFFLVCLLPFVFPQWLLRDPTFQKLLYLDVAANVVADISEDWEESTWCFGRDQIWIVICRPAFVTKCRYEIPPSVFNAASAIVMVQSCYNMLLFHCYTLIFYTAYCAFILNLCGGRRLLQRWSLLSLLFILCQPCPMLVVSLLSLPREFGLNVNQHRLKWQALPSQRGYRIPNNEKSPRLFPIYSHSMSSSLESVGQQSAIERTCVLSVAHWNLLKSFPFWAASAGRAVAQCVNCCVLS